MIGIILNKEDKEKLDELSHMNNSFSFTKLTTGELAMSPKDVGELPWGHAKDFLESLPQRDISNEIEYGAIE